MLNYTSSLGITWSSHFTLQHRGLDLDARNLSNMATVYTTGTPHRRGSKSTTAIHKSIDVLRKLARRLRSCTLPRRRLSMPEEGIKHFTIWITSLSGDQHWPCEAIFGKLHWHLPNLLIQKRLGYDCYLQKEAKWVVIPCRPQCGFFKVNGVWWLYFNIRQMRYLGFWPIENKSKHDHQNDNAHSLNDWFTGYDEDPPKAFRYCKRVHPMVGTQPKVKVEVKRRAAPKPVVKPISRSTFVSLMKQNHRKTVKNSYRDLTPTTVRPWSVVGRPDVQYIGDLDKIYPVYENPAREVIRQATHRKEKRQLALKRRDKEKMLYFLLRSLGWEVVMRGEHRGDEYMTLKRDETTRNNESYYSRYKKAKKTIRARHLTGIYYK